MNNDIFEKDVPHNTPTEDNANAFEQFGACMPTEDFTLTIMDKYEKHLEEVSKDVTATSVFCHEMERDMDRRFNAAADGIEKLNDMFQSYASSKDKLLSATLAMLICDTFVTVVMAIIFLFCR